jgi:hypothetical protein
MITRARRKSFDYKNMVKTIENFPEEDDEDSIIRLSLLDKEDEKEKERKSRAYIKKEGREIIKIIRKSQEEKIKEIEKGKKKERNTRKIHRRPGA